MCWKAKKNINGLGLKLFTRTFPKLCCQKKAKLLQDPKKFLLAHSSISTVLIFDLSISSKSLSTILFVVPDLVQYTKDVPNFCCQYVNVDTVGEFLAIIHIMIVQLRELQKVNFDKFQPPFVPFIFRNHPLITSV